MTITALSEDQRDALQEITNIAMGQAGASLAQILETYVNLSVPSSNILNASQVGEAITALVGKNSEITAVRQSYHGYLRGEAIVIFGQDGCNDIADLMGYDLEIDHLADQELLLDVSNILVGACLCGMCEQFHSITPSADNTDVSFAAPSIMAENVPVEALIKHDNLPWKHAMLIEINFRLDERNFISHVVMLMPEDAIEKVRVALDQFIASF